nr:hypothetical protein [Campylobacter troglodytis]
MQEALWFLRLWMRQMPLLLSFVLIGFYVAENLSTRCINLSKSTRYMGCGERWKMGCLEFGYRNEL